VTKGQLKRLAALRAQALGGIATPPRLTPQDEAALERAYMSGEVSTGLVQCPACLGAKNSMQFRIGDRAAGTETGWKAEPCAECGGKGEVTPDRAAVIEETLRKSIEEAQTQMKTSGMPWAGGEKGL
jgi:hypothetical protein